MVFNYNIHGLVTICSDRSLAIDNIELPDVFLVEDIEDPDIIIKIKEIDPKGFVSAERVGDKFRWDGETLYLNWGAPSIFNLSAAIKGLECDKTELTFSPFFWKFGNVSHIIGSSISIHLLKHNVTPVHAACISLNGQDILISGLSNMGKTSTILNLLSHFPNSKLYADDTVILGENIAYSFPREVGISPETDTGNIEMSSKSKFSKIFRDKVLKTPVISAFYNNRGSINLNQDIIGTSYPNQCYFLRDGPLGISELDSKEAAKLLFDSTQTLTHFRANSHHSVATYSYIMKSKMDLHEYEVERRSIVDNFFADVQCYEISSNKKGEFAQLIKDQLS
ncbi:hypothetical protein J2755_000897 [Methanohalophilus levihalophilus]|uniref:hypothetical protein n=1 Tax=Methanohalophilus levihalophilus TaxID=1431282 RepID=UPI001AE4431F|nr:hypothetical protein [Methanohalophilus levihalophilus]MBP2029963.1 hypothetical protein [Methanohalophilus levihalophilus]